MDQEYSKTGGTLSNLLILFCGVIISPIALGLLFSYPDPVWPIGILITVSSSLLIYSGIKGIRQTNKEAEHAKNFLQEIQMAANESAPAESSKQSSVPIVLAHWKYSGQQWKDFLGKETKSLLYEFVWTSIVIVAVATPILVFSEGASWLIAFLISCAFAFVFGLIKYNLKTSSIAANSNQSVEIIIGVDTVVINGKLNVLNDGHKTLKKIELKKEVSPALLEFTYYWQTRKGRANDELRVPVPHEKMIEAEEVVSKIKNYHGI